MGGRARPARPPGLPRRAPDAGAGPRPWPRPGAVAGRRRRPHAARARGGAGARRPRRADAAPAGAASCAREDFPPRRRRDRRAASWSGCRRPAMPPRDRRGFAAVRFERAVRPRAAGADAAASGRPAADPRRGLRRRRRASPAAKPRRPGWTVTGIERDPELAARARARCDRVLEGDLRDDPAGARRGRASASTRSSSPTCSSTSRIRSRRSRRRAPARGAAGARCSSACRTSGTSRSCATSSRAASIRSRRACRRGAPALVHALVSRRGARGGGLDARLDRGRARRARARAGRAPRARRAWPEADRESLPTYQWIAERRERRPAGRPMRIAYLLESTELFGGVKVVLLQAEALARRGHRVAVVSPDATPAWFPLARARFERSSFRESARARRRRRARRDVLEDGRARPRRRARPRLPPLPGLRGRDHVLPGRPLAEIERIYRLPTRKLAISATLARAARGTRLRPGDRRGPGLRRPTDSSRRRRAPAGDPPIVLVVGPIEADFKGIAIALEGLARFRRERADGSASGGSRTRP